MMELGDFLGRRPFGVLNLRMQNDFAELSGAVCVQFHRSFGIVAVPGDGNARVRAQVQKPQHVAARKRADQQFFRIVPVFVTAKHRRRRRRNRRFSFDYQLVIAAIGAVRARTGSAIPGPRQLKREMMLVVQQRQILLNSF
jgi:hypothetical protein